MVKKISQEEINQSLKWLEWKNDPVKFIEECLYIPTPGGDEHPKLYPPQRKIVRSFYKDKYLILLKSRQIGMSTICKLISTHLSIFYDNVKIGVISKDALAASAFCQDIEDMIDKIDKDNKWIIKGHIEGSPKSIYKKCNIKSFELKNGSGVTSAAVSNKNPGSTLRSASLSVLFMDECAFIDYIDDVWTGLGPTLSKAQQAARENDVPYGTVILSTPNGITGQGQWYYQNWIDATENEDCMWIPHKIHWKEIPDFKNDPEWIKKQHKIFKNDKRKISQELECKFISSDFALFSEEVQISLQDVINNKPYKIELFPEGGILWYFRAINSARAFIISVDCASAAGTDFSAVQVLDYITMEQVMEYKGKLRSKLFANVVKKIANKIPNNTIVVENQGGYGDVVLTELMEDNRITYNVYHEKRKTKKIPEPGISTNTSSRKLILDALFEIVTEDPHLVRSSRLVNELLSLVNKKGKIEASTGFNDDLAMAYGFACYARKFGMRNIDLITEENTEMVDEVYKGIVDMNDTDILHGVYNEKYSTSELNREILKTVKERLGTTTNHNIDIMSIFK